MSKKQNSRRKTGKKWLKILVLLFAIWAAGRVLAGSGGLASSIVGKIMTIEGGHEIPAVEEWNLIVVNRWNVIPEGAQAVSLTELSNGQKVDSRIYPYLQEMFDAMRAEGLCPVVREGYRTAQEQQEILDERIQRYRDEGYSGRSAEKAAKEWVAVPGTSEHQLGIAVDINADKTRGSNEEVYAWLAENAYKYGFILRYPQGREAATGAGYEPWHYRYVGKESAKIIFDKQICLEEFVERYY